MKVAVVVLAGLLGLVAGALAEEQSGAASSLSQAELDEALEDNLTNKRNARVFAFVSSTSITRLATTTITALSTCLSVAATACTGRKKRSIFNSLSDLEELVQVPVELEGSQSEDQELEAEQPKNLDSGRLGKRFTIWSSNFTTLTVTSTSFVAGTTVTASALCSAPGVTAGCFG